MTFDTPPRDGGSSRHNHPKGTIGPKTNRKFRDRKRETNMARDRRAIRIWQHSLKKCPTTCFKRIH